MLAFAGSVLAFYAPVLIANVLVYLIYSVIGLGIPLDLGKKLGSERLFGDGRSVNGTIAYMIIGALVGMLQGRIVEGLYLGAGGNFGCIANSFIKRRLGISRGKNFVPLDQTDMILGASLFYASLAPLRLSVLMSGLFFCGVLHITVNVFFRRWWENLVRYKTRNAE